MKSLYHIIIVLAMLAVTWVGCSDEDTLMTVDMENSQEQNSSFNVNMNISVPDPIKVTSRNAEYDAIESMTLLCFNGQGKLISISTPIFDKDNRTLTADITYTTRVIHLIANQAISGLSLNSTTEIEVANMLGTANKMIYWARVEIPSTEQGSANIAAWFNRMFDGSFDDNGELKAIKLLRNQAKITIQSNQDDDAIPYVTVTDFMVYNTSSQGTVAPYHTKKKFPTITSDSFGLDEWAKENYVRIFNGTGNIETISDDLTDGIISPIYAYETEYSDNTFIIFKGYNTKDGNGEGKVKYWRVAFKDAENKSLNIRRNHHYDVTITGRLLLESGYDNLSDACAPNAKTVNDAYLSIAPEITAVTDGDASLMVDNTSYVVTNGIEVVEFNFSIKKDEKSTENLFKKNLSVKWNDDDDAKEQTITDLEELTDAYTLKDENGTDLTAEDINALVPHTELNAKIIIPLKKIGSDNQPLEGVIKIQYGQKLLRKVTIKVIPKMQFTVTKNETLNPVDKTKEPIATMTFNVPDNYQGSYPFNVFISTEHFNVKIEKPKTNPEDTKELIGLPLIFPGDAGYAPDNGIGYKYVYQVNAPGNHTIELITNGVVTEYGKVTLESEHFETYTDDKINLMRN